MKTLIRLTFRIVILGSAYVLGTEMNLHGKALQLLSMAKEFLR